MLIIAKSHSDRLAQAAKIMFQYWLPLIVLPALIGVISTYLLMPLILFGVFPLLTAIQPVGGISLNPLATLAGRLVLILITATPLIIAALLSKQVILYALTEINSSRTPAIKSLLLASLKTVIKFLWLGIYTWIYVYKYVFVSMLVMLIILVLWSFLPMSNSATFISYIFGLAGTVASLAGIIMVILRQIRVTFVEVAWIEGSHSAAAALSQGLETAKHNWRDTLTLFGIIFGLSLIVNMLVGNDNLLYSLLMMLVGSFTTILTYLFYKHLTSSANQTQTNNTSSQAPINTAGL